MLYVNIKNVPKETQYISESKKQEESSFAGWIDGWMDGWMDGWNRWRRPPRSLTRFLPATPTTSHTPSHHHHPHHAPLTLSLSRQSHQTPPSAINDLSCSGDPSRLVDFSVSPTASSKRGSPVLRLIDRLFLCRSLLLVFCLTVGGACFCVLLFGLFSLFLFLFLFFLFFVCLLYTSPSPRDRG